MKSEQFLDIASIEAAADISQGYFIGFDGNLCAVGAKALGVSCADTLTGQQLPVAVRGIKLVLAGAAIAAGHPVTADASSKAVEVDDLTVAALGVTLDDSKLEIDSGATPMTSSAANGAVISAGVDAVVAVPPTLAGGVLPVAINGYALDEATEADELIRVLLV